MTREEAIQIVKTTKDWGELRLALQELVPELRESEDERIRNVIANLISYGVVPKKEDREKALAWLKKQKEQKPAGWSEEEERILKGIIGKINHDQNYGVSKAEMLSFLKRLRPSWKPNGISMVEDGS